MGQVPAFAGMTRRLGIRGDGALPRLWRYRADWIPAYAGMTGAGMTGMGAGMGKNGWHGRMARGLYTWL